METQGLVHHGSNAGQEAGGDRDRLAARGRRAAVDAGRAERDRDRRSQLQADLESQSRTLHTVGADGSITYGWNQLVGTATVDGQPVGVELLGNVSYVKGSGPIFGFVTYTFADGSTLGVQMQGAATATDDGDDDDVRRDARRARRHRPLRVGHGDRHLHRVAHGGAGHDGGVDLRPDHRRSELT